jgi:hypothetical protein
MKKILQFILIFVWAGIAVAQSLYPPPPGYKPYPGNQPVTVTNSLVYAQTITMAAGVPVTYSNPGFCTLFINNLTANPSDNGIQPSDSSGNNLPIYKPKAGWSGSAAQDFFNIGTYFVDVLKQGYVPVGGVSQIILTGVDAGLPATITISWSTQCLDGLISPFQADFDTWLKGGNAYAPAVSIVNLPPSGEYGPATFTTTGASAAFGPFNPQVSKFSIFCKTTGTIGAATIQLEGSRDGTNFDTSASHALASGSMSTFSGTDYFAPSTFTGGLVPYVRIDCTALTLGAGTNVICYAEVSK